MVTSEVHGGQAHLISNLDVPKNQGDCCGYLMRRQPLDDSACPIGFDQ
jgi:hypothetical protein